MAPTLPDLATAPAFQLGDWMVDPTLLRLTRGDTIHQVEPKMMQVLLVLAQVPQQVVPRATLHTLIWPDAIVTEKTLTVTVSKLRKLLGDTPQAPTYIETISKSGYRLIAPVTPRSSSTHLEPTPSTRYPLLLVGLVMVVMVMGIGLVAYWPEPTDDAPGSQQLTTAFGHELQSALSPNGELVAYTAQDSTGNWDLYVLQVGTTTPLRRTQHAAEDLHPAWSPDGTELAFLRFGEDTCGLFAMPALAGAERQLLPCNQHMRRGHLYFGPSLAWAPDGTSIALTYRGSDTTAYAIYRFDLATSSLTPITRPDGYVTDQYPAFSADGTELAFTRVGRRGSEVWVHNLTSGAETQLTFDYRGILGLAWAPDDQHLYFSSNRRGLWQMWRVHRFTQQIDWVPLTGWHVKQPSITRSSSRMVYENWAYDNNIWRLSLADTTAAPTRLVASTQWELSPAYSPDGQRLAFFSNRSGFYELWVSAADGTQPQQITTLEGPIVGSLSWSPDGQYLAFDARDEAYSRLFVVTVAGGPPVLLTDGSYDVLAPAWSADGTMLYFGSDRTKQWQIWQVSRAGGAPMQVTQHGGYAAQADEGGQHLYVAHNDSLWRVSLLDEARQPVAALPNRRTWDNWQVTPQGVYYTMPGPKLAFYNASTQTHRPLTDLPSAFFSGLTVSPDGRWLAYTQLDQAENDLMLTTWPSGF
ncbi:MAG: winged helix-turn-helix domain-containing protein [Rhodothermales bacterium]